jgi:hypothetical protein
LPIIKDCNTQSCPTGPNDFCTFDQSGQCVGKKCTIRTQGYKKECVPMCSMHTCPPHYKIKDQYSPCDRSVRSSLEQCCEPIDQSIQTLIGCNDQHPCAGDSQCQTDGFCSPISKEGPGLRLRPGGMNNGITNWATQIGSAFTNMIGQSSGGHNGGGGHNGSAFRQTGGHIEGGGYR